MLILAVSIVAIWALVLGMSPGLSLIAVAVAAMAVDRYDPTLIDRLRSRR